MPKEHKDKKNNKYPHASVYFNSEEDKQLYAKLKEEADKNHINLSDYFKQLARIGQDTQLYNLPNEVTGNPDQSVEIKALEEELAKQKGDIARMTQLKNTGFDWNKILTTLDTTNYKMETTILEELDIIGGCLFDEDFNADFIEMQIAELQANLFLRKEYYKDVEYKQNRGWRLCSK